MLLARDAQRHTSMTHTATIVYTYDLHSTRSADTHFKPIRMVSDHSLGSSRDLHRLGTLPHAIVCNSPTGGHT